MGKKRRGPWPSSSNKRLSCSMQYNSKVAFKKYAPNQVMLLPPSLDEMIDLHHPVRVVNQVIDQIDIGPLLKKYKGGGTSSYHPRLMLKILVYGYVTNIYSSRQLEASLKDSLCFMWLSGMSKPDHNTINRFRSERLKSVLKTIFGKVVGLLIEAGHLSLKEVFTDGTKIESRANRFTFVWGNGIKTSKERMEAQLQELWEYAERVAADELKDEAPENFAPVSPKKVRKVIEKIDKALKDKDIEPKKRRQIENIRKTWPDRLKRYKKQEKILGKRNSYSKTDTDATFMRMKGDRMPKAQLRPAYNVQLSTNNQFIANYSIHQTAADTNTLKSHLDGFKALYQQYPENVIADAAYGSEENLLMVAKRNITGYLKHTQFDRNEAGKNNDPFQADNLSYDDTQDVLFCPSGKPMKRIGEGTSKTTTGFQQTLTKYQASGCSKCPLRNRCNPKPGNRVVGINHRLRKLRGDLDKRLTSAQGVAYRKQRSVDVETVFANIKHNKNYKRFIVNGLDKVEIQTGLLAIAHNLAKLRP